MNKDENNKEEILGPLCHQGTIGDSFEDIEMQKALKKKRIEEKNGIIATYMGYKLITPAMRYNPKEWNFSYWEKKEEGRGKDVLGGENKLDYEYSWNSLMMVVKKITEEFGSRDHRVIVARGTWHSITRMKESLLAANIDETWESVVKYIEHHQQMQSK